jgi:hypothetical protein
MWFLKNNSEPTKNLLHGVDMNFWDYLGSTEIKWNRVPCRIYFFRSKDTETRKYVLVGVPELLINEVKNFHSFVYNACELWRSGEVELYSVIHEPSKFLKAWVFETERWVWNTEKRWWALATEKDKYDYVVSTHRKETPEIIRDDTNLIKVDFKGNNNG